MHCPRIAKGRCASKLASKTKPTAFLRFFLLITMTHTLFCRQIHAMGFPAKRVVRTCQALGEDSQQIIHFCLLVDQFVEVEKFPEEEVS